MPRLPKITRKRKAGKKAKPENDIKQVAEKAEAVEPEQDEVYNDSDFENEAPLIEELPPDMEGRPLGDLTLAELADLAQPFSHRSIETLKRLKREELIYIITQQKDDFNARENATLGNDVKDIIELFIEILQESKMKRCGKELNGLLVKIIRKQDRKIAEYAVRAGASGSAVGIIILCIAVLGLIVDALWGLDYIARLFEKDNAKSAGTVAGA